MLVLGVVQNGAGYTFYNYGIQKVSAQKASVIALWEMILRGRSGWPVLKGIPAASGSDRL